MYMFASNHMCVHTSSCPIGSFPFYMLIETSGSNGDHDGEKLTEFCSLSMEAGRVVDGTVTNDQTKRAVPKSSHKHHSHIP